ncbi:MAG TPA: ABC transporter ATP-binding protein [Bryobacteraceae bacterium]|nr:ABC transporter ATP-binding protein [Bryobacteraceae bacterium]
MNAVEFEHVSKGYAIYDKPGHRLGELLSFGRRSRHRDFWALRDLSFTIKRGEVFCIVGENGSGKSTTLQIIAGITQPSHGSARVEGRVSALLELGSGFNPEFTGRDNVYLNAAILGLSRREIDRRYPAIEEFAEIGDFIRQPVKTYSSGMAMRLAFAVAINVDPEVLLVDEALAVGDTYFRHRCMRKVHELRARGVTIVFVSHAIADVQAVGDHVLWLEHGSPIAIGETSVVLPLYLAAMAARGEESCGPKAIAPAGAALPAATASVPVVESIPNVDHRHGDGRADILGIAVLNEFAEPVHLMMPNSRIVIRISFRANEDLKQPVAGFMLRNHLGLDFTDTDTEREGRSLPPMHAGQVSTVDFQFDIPEFYPGTFSFSPSVSDVLAGETGRRVCDWIDNAITVQMARGEGPVYGYIQLPCRIELRRGELTKAEFSAADLSAAGQGESRLA